MAQVDIAIYGAGGMGRETAWLAQTATAQTYRVVCFIDDNQAAQETVLNGIPVMSLAETQRRFPLARVVTAVGSPHLRARLVEQAAAAGFRFETLIHRDVERSQWVEIGAGTVICAGSIVTTNVMLGEHVQVNTACTIAHDAVLADYATLAPGVHISGNVHLGPRAYVGTGAVIINGTPDDPIVIGADAVVGAGACVLRSVEPGATVVGVPARPIQRT